MLSSEVQKGGDKMRKTFTHTRSVSQVMGFFLILYIYRYIYKIINVFYVYQHAYLYL